MVKMRECQTMNVKLEKEGARRKKGELAVGRTPGPHLLEDIVRSHHYVRGVNGPLLSFLVWSLRITIPSPRRATLAISRARGNSLGCHTGHLCLSVPGRVSLGDSGRDRKMIARTTQPCHSKNTPPPDRGAFADSEDGERLGWAVARLLASSPGPDQGDVGTVGQEWVSAAHNRVS